MGYLGAPESIMRLNDVIRASEVSWSSWRKWPYCTAIPQRKKWSKRRKRWENGLDLGAPERIMRSEPQIGAPEVP